MFLKTLQLSITFWKISLLELSGAYLKVISYLSFFMWSWLNYYSVCLSILLFTMYLLFGSRILRNLSTIPLYSLFYLNLRCTKLLYVDWQENWGLKISNYGSTTFIPSIFLFFCSLNLDLLIRRASACSWDYLRFWLFYLGLLW